MPEEYQEYIWIPEQIPQNMDFIHYEVLKSARWNRVLSLYRNKEQEVRLEIISRIFAPGVEYYAQQYDSYDFLYSNEYNGNILDFFEKVNDDGTEYAACFFYNNVQYIVQGNLTLAEIELLADQYCDNILGSE